jgi:hypothetical protein
MGVEGDKKEERTPRMAVHHSLSLLFIAFTLGSQIR